MSVKVDKTGETNINRDGKFLEIIDYRTMHSIDVQIDHNEIIYNVDYMKFKRGTLGLINIQNESKGRLQKVGLYARKIKRFNHDVKCSIEFEDGTIKDYVYTSGYYKGTITHPKYKKCIEAYMYENKKYFLCKCRVCKRLHLLALDEMKDFQCNEVQQ